MRCFAHPRAWKFLALGKVAWGQLWRLCLLVKSLRCEKMVRKLAKKDVNEEENHSSKAKTTLES